MQVKVGCTDRPAKLCTYDNVQQSYPAGQSRYRLLLSFLPGDGVQMFLHLMSGPGALPLFTLQVAQHPLFCAQAIHGDTVTVSGKICCCQLAFFRS